jgi:uncharacterized DUF497 family protein
LGVQKYVEITYDPSKRADTIKDRGLDFADAAEVFAGDYTIAPDDRRNYGEPLHLGGGICGAAWWCSYGRLAATRGTSSR